MQHVGLILNVENPVIVTIVKQALESIDGVRIIYITIRNDKKLYIVDQEGVTQ